jgi:hypothetical protein
MLTPERRREIEASLSAARAARQCSMPSGSDDSVFGALATLAFDTPLHAMARELLAEVDRLNFRLHDMAETALAALRTEHEYPLYRDGKWVAPYAVDGDLWKFSTFDRREEAYKAMRDAIRNAAE